MEIKGNINAGYGNNISASTKSSIVGGSGNVVSGNNNLIGGGSGNTVNTNYGVIVGGTGNQIPSGAATRSSIVGGLGNQIVNSSSSFIGGGGGNTLNQNSNYAVIGGGYGNTIGTAGTATINGGGSVIVGGLYHYISSGGKGLETTNAFIGGGYSHHIYEGTYSFIGGGTNNRLTGNTSTIVAGGGNRINGFRGFIGGGDTNIIESAADALIGNGKNNYIGAGANYSAILNGANNYIKPIGGGNLYQSHNLIAAGSGNRMELYSNVSSSRGYNVILGSEKANMYGYSYKTHNTIIGTGWLWSTPISNYSSAIYGSNNTILGGVASYFDRTQNPTTGITHGIIGSSYVSTLIGGYGNLINGGYYSTIVGGYHNYMGNGVNSSFIGPGYGNTIKSSYSFIGSGDRNYISQQGSGVSILGGAFNLITGTSTVNVSSILGGSDNLMKSSYSSIVGGMFNHSKHDGSHVIGSHVESVSVNTTSVNNLHIQSIPNNSSMKSIGVDANGVITDDNIISLNEFTGNTDSYYLRVAGSATTTGFASNTILPRTSNILDSTQDSNGDIYLVGYFTNFGQYDYNSIVKLTENGIVDTTFTSYAPNNTFIRAVDVQSDGKILIGGDFTTYSGQSRNRIARLNTDGTLDTTFVVGTGFNSRVESIKIQPDGKILVGGFFNSYSGTGRNRIIRLNTDGTIDGTFSIGTGFNSIVYSISLQSDGKILVGGSFSSYNGTGRSRFARINTGGTIDGTFTVGAGFDRVPYDSVELSDGNILVVGQFETYDGNTAQGIAKLSSTGTFDGTFSASTGFTDTQGGVPSLATVYSVLEDSDNKYVVGGKFDTYSGQSYNRIVRFETGGTIDTTFISAGEGFKRTFGANPNTYPQVNDVIELNNGTYLASGYLLNEFVNPDINKRANHYNIDKNGNVTTLSYSREEYKTSVANVLGSVPTFTGNTSGDCISELWVTSISGCSPVYINGVANFDDVNNSVNITGKLNTSSSVTRKTRTVDSGGDPSLNDTDHVVFYTTGLAGGTITLPSAVNGREIILVRTSGLLSANVSGLGGALINGLGVKVLPTTLYSTITLISDGTNWYATSATVL